jgi:uncharacterized membrane protein YvbJ
LLVPHIYDRLHSEDYHSDFWIVRKYDKYGIINATGEIVVPLEYKKITVFSRKRRSHYAQSNFFELEKEGEQSLIFDRKHITSEPYIHMKTIQFSTEDRE